ncbi:virulence factor SrfC like protein [Caenispirillum salinarum AK4]|uniref:Virulence factor SrfC like protein n=1 Tax=Caenispirillum salinarum AK4 TaxID=1238182 RepID=K9H1X6_9PROT|nr:virulence factor SrfC family protein [Caenispirillum salinarum]EKV32260.1 virulence factor SrfC like protein [Caenispirillum salinarum AK4]
MLRDKDAVLGKQCKDMAAACRQALDWFGDNEKIVGYRRANLERLFKKNAVEALKLANAAERPMSVGVFGASQAGKSFLTGSFIAPKDNPIKVIFGDEKNPVRMDFLSEVNPTGGDETTGLVTRFSIRHRRPPSNDYPVTLRLLTEGDIIKILANTFTLDLRAKPERAFSQAVLTELTGAAESVRQDAVQPGLPVESILDLEQYIQEELEDHPLNKEEALREEYWLTLERLAPNLRAAERAKLVAPLWGEIPEFTDLYLELRGALDSIGHPGFVYVPLDAIRDRARGVLHVQTIYHLDPANEDGSFAQDGVDQVTVMAENGRTASLRKAVVTALTAELLVTLEDKPWPFLEHTDLLDFPGARGRESKTATEFFRGGEDTKPQNRAYCFLRGKIAVLFDKYSAELDLNTMLLCSDDRNQEVRKLAELIQRWVARTHGATAQDRLNCKTALMLCMTKADTLFDRKAGATMEESVSARLRKDITFYQSWMKRWAGDQPFDNVVFARNPKFQRRDLFAYEDAPDGAPEGFVPQETGLLDAPEMERFKQTFREISFVQEHVADPDERVDAILSLNDGGISYIAKKLAPTCDPDLKFNQIRPRALSLAERMRNTLTEFYEAGDVAQRVAERRAEAMKVVKCLQSKVALIGQFIAALETDEDTMATVFLDVARGETGDVAPADSAAEAVPAMADAGFDGTAAIDLGDLFDEGDGAGAAPAAGEETAPVKQGLAALYGEAAVRRWLMRISDAAQNAKLTQTYGLGPAEFAAVVQELEIAARRYKVANRIAELVQPIIQYHQRPDEHMHRVAMVSAMEINRLVNFLGRDRPEAENKGDVLFKREAPEVVDGLPVLPDDNNELRRVRGAALRDWLKGLVLLAEESAASNEGGVIDVEQNARMGSIIALVPAEVAQ